jgi:poly-beta-1,6-N-acetyl-D-glucosamine synthase
VNLPSYILVTPARNEVRYIELTLKSVVAQTVRPLRWVIVSDGSTDATDEIVSDYAARHPWIEFMRMPERKERDFAGKVRAFNGGLARLNGLDYDAIGSLDGDISFGDDYFAFLLHKLAETPELGLVGTPFSEGSRQIYDYRFANVEHVSGACQLFRRECFEAIGGYMPIKLGGVDHFMVISARMLGWKTRTFAERVCQHHRQMGSAKHGLLRSRFVLGAKDYAFGYHPLWELLRASYQCTKSPFAVGGLLILSGYIWSALKRQPRPVSCDFVRFTRKEQMARLRQAFLRKRR